MPNSSNSYSRTIFEEYKTLLRKEMKAPHANDKDLISNINKNYRANANIGSGSTAAAIRYEKANEEMVGGRYHTQKGKDYIF